MMTVLVNPNTGFQIIYNDNMLVKENKLKTEYKRTDKQYKENKSITK